jgi:DNA sulfur modification protein DndB
VIHHGRDVEWARQTFHDLNALAVKPNTAVAISMDSRDPVTRIARRVEEEVPFFTGRVNLRRRQLRRNYPEVVTVSVLRTACLTVAFGMSGLQYGLRTPPAEQFEHEVERIERVTVVWLDAVSSALGDELAPERRGTSILPGPAAMAAVGAFGHPLLDVGEDDLDQEAEDKAEELATVDWSRGEHWVGIAGKIAPSGRFSTAGGAKENAHAIYQALSDPGYKGFRQIRRAAAPAIP